MSEDNGASFFSSYIALWEQISRRLFGDDIFISYSRADGFSYAAALATRLAERKLVCRFDQWGTVPGAKVPASILRSVTRSGLLVILATPKACKSSVVEDEIREFLKTGRTIVPVRLCRDITKARWWPLIQGLAISSEPLLAVDQNGSGEAPVPEAPSEATISRIVNSISFQTRNQRLRRDASAALAVLLLSIIGAVFEARVAKTNAAKADQEQKMEHRAGLLYKARTALNNQDPRLAARLSLEARQVADGGDARLVFAEAYNSGVPFELPPLFRDIRLFHLDPSNPRSLACDWQSGRNTALSQPTRADRCPYSEPDLGFELPVLGGRFRTRRRQNLRSGDHKV